MFTTIVIEKDITVLDRRMVGRHHYACKRKELLKIGIKKSTMTLASPSGKQTAHKAEDEKKGRSGGSPQTPSMRLNRFGWMPHIKHARTHGFGDFYAGEFKEMASS
jgi:hypothetical protein